MYLKHGFNHLESSCYNDCKDDHLLPDGSLPRIYTLDNGEVKVSIVLSGHKRSRKCRLTLLIQELEFYLDVSDSCAILAIVADAIADRLEDCEDLVYTAQMIVEEFKMIQVWRDHNYGM